MLSKLSLMEPAGIPFVLSADSRVIWCAMLILGGTDWSVSGSETRLRRNRVGLLCGSISSVLILIGAKFGRTSIEENPQPIWQMVDEYVAAFREEFKTVNCRQLTGLELKTEEGLKQYFAKVHDYECTEQLKFAVEKALEILQK